MRKRFCSIFLCILLLPCLSTIVRADGSVTDTLTVKIGYFGMPAEEFAEVGTYHWSQLSNELPINECAYSFFRQDLNGNYSIVIDSARGFYLTDLIDYVNVYAGDIQSIQFFTRDQDVGFFTSFTYAELFETQRYFYNDLAAHVHPTSYDDAGNVTEYTVDDTAWSDCSVVWPMLALEDSWVSYELGTEHTAPNFAANMNAGNRFRLLFGQSSPTENLASQTAKYTHTVLITLQGAPEIKDTLPELDQTIGSHSVSFDVSIGNEALLDALSSLLQLRSSDSSVLEFTGFTVTPSSEYSDIATITADYTVHRAGTTSVSIGFGSVEIASAFELTTTEPPADNTNPSEGSNTPQGDPEDGSLSSRDPNSSLNSDQTSTPTPTPDPTQNSTPASTPELTPDPTPDPAPELTPDPTPDPAPESTSKPTSDPSPDPVLSGSQSTPSDSPTPQQSNNPPTQSREPSRPDTDKKQEPAVDSAQPELSEEVSDPQSLEPSLDPAAYRLSADLAARLQPTQQAASREKPQEELAPQESVTALAVLPKDNRRYLLGTGAGTLLLCLLGAMASKYYYKKERE